MIASLLALSLIVPPSAAAAGPSSDGGEATAVALELNRQRIELVQMQTLCRENHPQVRLQAGRVRMLEQTLAELEQRGYRVDPDKVDAMFDLLIARTKAELAEARQVFAHAHPRLALLEMRLQSIGQVAARWALVG